MGLTGGVFFSTCLYSFAISSMLAWVAASNCLLASTLLVSGFVVKRLLSAHTNDLIGQILLRALGLGRQQRGDGCTSEGTADLSRAGIPELLQDSRLLLTETPGVEVDSPAIAFKPLRPGEDLLELAAREEVEGEGNKGLGQHYE